MQRSPLLRRLGDRIKSIRKEQGLSQEELADKAGLDRTYVGGIERGERNVSILNLEKIGKALNVGIAHFFTDIDGPPSIGGTSS